MKTIFYYNTKELKIKPVQVFTDSLQNNYQVVVLTEAWLDTFINVYNIKNSTSNV